MLIKMLICLWPDAWFIIEISFVDEQKCLSLSSATIINNKTGFANQKHYI
jgi:hypothetical protein